MDQNQNPPEYSQIDTNSYIGKQSVPPSPRSQSPPPPMSNPSQIPPVYITLGQQIDLGPLPSNLNCPQCQKQVISRVTYKVGLLTWIVAIGLFFAGGICCLIPFVFESFKDADHSCPNCNTFLGKHERCKI